MKGVDPRTTAVEAAMARLIAEGPLVGNTRTVKEWLGCTPESLRRHAPEGKIVRVVRSGRWLQTVTVSLEDR